MDTNIPWIFGSSRLIVFIVLSDSVDLQFYMSLLKILCLFDLDSKDFGDETSTKWYLLISFFIEVSGTLQTTPPCVLYIYCWIHWMFLLNISWVPLTHWDPFYILMQKIEYLCPIAFAKLNLSCLYVLFIEFFALLPHPWGQYVSHNLDYVIGIVEIGMLSYWAIFQSPYPWGKYIRVTLPMRAIHGSDSSYGSNTQDMAS